MKERMEERNGRSLRKGFEGREGRRKGRRTGTEEGNDQRKAERRGRKERRGGIEEMWEGKHVTHG